MADNLQRHGFAVNFHVLVCLQKVAGQHHYYLYHRHQSYLLQTDNDKHSWLLPFPRLSSATYWSVSPSVWLSPPLLPPCPSPLSVALFLSLTLSLPLPPSLSLPLSVSLFHAFFLLFFHPVSPVPLSPALPPLSVPFTHCLHSFHFVCQLEPRCMKQQSVILL